MGALGLGDRLLDPVSHLPAGAMDRHAGLGHHLRGTVGFIHSRAGRVEYLASRQRAGRIIELRKRSGDGSTDCDRQHDRQRQHDQDTQHHGPQRRKHAGQQVVAGDGDQRRPAGGRCMAEERRYRHVVPSDGLHLAVDACRGLQLADEIGAGALADVFVRIAGARDDGLVLIQNHPEPLLRQRLLLQQRTDACNRKVHGQVVNDLAAADHRVADGDALRPRHWVAERRADVGLRGGYEGSKVRQAWQGCAKRMIRVSQGGALRIVDHHAGAHRMFGLLKALVEGPHVTFDDRWGRRERRDDGGIPTQLAIDGQRDGSRNFLHALIDLRRLRTIDRIGAIQRKRECRGYNGNDQPNQTGANRHGARVPDGSATLGALGVPQHNSGHALEARAGLIADDRGAGPGFRAAVLGRLQPPRAFIGRPAPGLHRARQRTPQTRDGARPEPAATRRPPCEKHGPASRRWQR